MICPRCGRSTPGNVCPYCDGPQIEDYTDDYIKRKKEYESFSETTEDAGKDKPQEEKKQVSFRRFIIPVVIAAAAVTAAVIAVNIIKDYRPAPEYDGVAICTLEGRYYRLTDTDTEEIGDTKTLFFNGDGTRGYKTNAAVELVSGDNIRTDKTMSDDGGGYFACSVYDSSSEKDNYKLFVWSKDGKPAEKVSSNGMIGIKYISDTGMVFFTKTDVITDELGTGGTSLWCCDPGGDTPVKLEDSIYSVNFYSKTGSVIIRDEDGGLYLIKMSDLSHRNRIADGVSDLMPENKGFNNFFKTTEAVVNSDDSADRFCYVKNNRIYMYDLSSGGSVDIGGAGGSDVSVSYDDVNRVVYLADTKSLTCGVLDGDRINDKKNLDADHAGGSIIWNDHKKTLLLLSSEGMLKKVVNRQLSDVSDKKGAKGLISPENDGGFAFVSDGVFYYGSAFDKEPRSLGEVTSEDITSAVRANGYIYRIEGRRLIAAKDDGTYTKDMGECESLWSGRL